jgi:hypothetical protein
MKSIEVRVDIRKYCNICIFDINPDVFKGFYVMWSRDLDEFDTLECLWGIMFRAFRKKGQDEDKY